MPTTPDPNPWYYRGKRTNTYTDKLQPGDIIVAKRRPYRVREITPRPHINWNEEYLTAWERSGRPDPDTWQQPWFLWTLRSSATDSGLVMVDTGTSGQCAVMETEDERATRFAPLSSYNVWLTLNWLISESLPRD